MKRDFGDRVYTIGLFAEAGECYSLSDMDDVMEGPLRPAIEYGLEGQLSQLRNGKDYFVDFASLTKSDTKWISQSTTTRREGAGKMTVIPSHDFDGGIFIHKISKPRLPWTK